MEMHFATVWESIADVIGDQPALVHGGDVRTWAEYDERAARVAATLVDAGLRPGAKVALLMYNGNEYLESQFGVFKMRGVAINVNYRYLDDELVYLLDNSDSEALIFHASLAERVARIATRLPELQLLIEVDDVTGTATATGTGTAGAVPGALAYEDALAGHDPMPRIERSEDDIYMLYTGGTTGMPKGVMYAMGGVTAGFVESSFPVFGLTVTADAAAIAPMVADLIASGNRVVSIPCAPLMHGTGVWLGAMMPQLGGATVVTLLSRSLDADELLATVQRERATTMTIVGDAFSKAIIAALDAATLAGRPYDTSSLKLIISSGVMWTSEVKQEVIERIEQAMLIDAIGSTEGTMGISITMKGLPSSTGSFSQMATTKVFTEQGHEVRPGSDDIGLVAAGGNVPLGYYKDEEKSARTFRTIDGKRYSFPGDMAKVAADGSLILLGRGSQVINSGGEKVFPEEVEEAVKRVEGVRDALVIGIDDERFGQAVTAIASREDGAEVDEADVIAGVKGQLAGYKAPKRVVFVSEVPRGANGKADYPRAKQYALDG
ncbi:MAG: fatty-acid--CoA ligase [Ilumatobacteraceae bacterium]|nr:fatty-acid--CoA ligase [Ilumatobacteraceae bacterium]